MNATRNSADELARLQAVQIRIRALSREHTWFGDAIRVAFNDHLALGEQYGTEQAAMRDWKYQLARELLENKRLFDPKINYNSPCMFLKITGLCPVALADRLNKHHQHDTLPRKLEREGAAAALLALDRDTTYQARDLPEDTRAAMETEYRDAQAAGTHVSFHWRIAVAKPADWKEPANPHTLDRADLEQMSEADYRTIALHRLGGLADAGALRPIVPKPIDTGDNVHDYAAYAAWRFRFPIDDELLDQNLPPLSVRAFPPNIAEQMLEDVEVWAKSEAAARGGSITARGPSMSPELLEGLQRPASAVDAGAIDRVADPAGEKVAKVLGACDDCATKPTPPPAGDETIDENDAALLAFLNQNPNLRRKVSDVLPEKGPQDRKAVANRLRKLADRRPALVDYPKNKRTGVAILPAGAEALKRATTPTPH